MFSRIPLTALRAFESAARLGSFKAAANELAVTPTAVSHQIKSLESWLGILLFERKPMAVSLTPEGEEIYRNCHAAFQQINDSLEFVRPGASDKNLVLTTTPAFASAWLIPRLDRFHDRHPHLHIAVETSDTVVDLLRDARVDLAIRCTTHDFPSLIQRTLFSEYFGAYGTPDFDPDDKDETINLIAVRWSTPSPIEVSWQDWCKRAGCQDWLERATFHNYDDDHYALQAAQHSRSAVLASSVLVVDQVTAGTLRPIKPSVKLPGMHYLALCRPGRERSAPISAFLEWLEDEAQQTRLALSEIGGS